MFSKYHNRQKGFTLIELMIVVVIIGILAALAIPRFMQATVKAKESEAKTILRQIYTLERTYRQEHGTYIADLNAIGWVLPTESSRRFDYAISAAALNTFSATATPNGSDGDVTTTFTIDQNGDITP